jgi:hypothetical protein
MARVEELLNEQPCPGSCSAATDDEFIDKMRQFLILYQPSTPAGRQRLAVKFPGPYGALQLRQSRPPELRLAVECRILARQSDTVIAQKTALTPAAIGWYEKMFFSVRDALPAPDWVAANVLHPSCLENLSPLEGPLKQIAYEGGPDLYETMKSLLPQRDDLEAPAELEDDLDEMVNAVIRRRAVFCGMDSNKDNSRELVSLGRLLQSSAALKHDVGGGSTARELMVAEAVRSTIDAIKFFTGDAAVEDLEKNCPDMLEFDKAAAELRDHQLYDVIIGKGAKYEHLKSMKMPLARGPREDPPGSDHPDASAGST